MNSSPPRKWVTVRQISEIFQISPKTIFSLIARGRLPDGSVLRIGRQIRLNVGAIECSALYHAKKDGVK